MGGAVEGTNLAERMGIAGGTEQQNPAEREPAGCEEKQ